MIAASNKPTKEVLEIGEINITGNVTPNAWYQHLVYDSGKPRLVAITILSEIVYWYRPSEVKDEETGRFIGYKKKFKGDKLQRSYGTFAAQFGITKKQARDAMAYLEEVGAVSKELRIVATKGVTLSNVLFIGIFPERIKEMCRPKDTAPCDIQVIPSDIQVIPSDIQVTPSIPTGQTYTKSTTGTTTDNNGLAPNEDFSDLFPEDSESTPNPEQSNGKPNPQNLTEEDKAHLQTFGFLPGKKPLTYDIRQEMLQAGWRITITNVEKVIALYILLVREYRPKFAIPNDISIRKDWHKAIQGHLQDYPLDDLPKLYKKALARLDDGKLTYTRPGSLTKILADVASEEPAKGINFDKKARKGLVAAY